jgi:hypothetical protein
MQKWQGKIAYKAAGATIYLHQESGCKLSLTFAQINILKICKRVGWKLIKEV